MDRARIGKGRALEGGDKIVIRQLTKYKGVLGLPELG